MAGIASAATAVVIAHVAAGTTTIRVGAGGIMLPNHSPLVIAEQFGTLAALHPGRIDLGLGRAPGTDQLTLRALRRTPSSADSFPHDVLELQALLGDPAAGAGGARDPGHRLARAALDPRLEPLRRPARRDARAAVRVRLALRARTRSCRRSSSTAPSSGRRSSSSGRTRWSRRTSSPPTTTPRRGGCSPRCSRRSRTSSAADAGQLPPPIDDIETYWSPAEKARVTSMLRRSFVGSAETVAAGAQRLRRGDRRRRADRRLRDPRPRRAAQVLRDPRRHPRGASGTRNAERRPDARSRRSAGTAASRGVCSMRRWQAPAATRTKSVAKPSMNPSVSPQATVVFRPMVRQTARSGSSTTYRIEPAARARNATDSAALTQACPSSVPRNVGPPPINPTTTRKPQLGTLPLDPGERADDSEPFGGVVEC